MGATTQQPAPGRTGYKKGCVWGTATAISCRWTSARSEPREADAAYEDALSSSDQLEDVSGLGDKACWAGKSSRCSCQGKILGDNKRFPAGEGAFPTPAYAAAELAIRALP